MLYINFYGKYIMLKGVFGTKENIFRQKKFLKNVSNGICFPEKQVGFLAYLSCLVGKSKIFSIVRLVNENILLENIFDFWLESRK